MGLMINHRRGKFTLIKGIFLQQEIYPAFGAGTMLKSVFQTLFYIWYQGSAIR
jgi:hypothetical protein